MWTSLIGFMASGKTTITRHLQSASSRPVVCIDELVADEAGMSIPEIFEIQGEAAFRQLEVKAVNNLDAERNLILDTGGGLVESPSAVKVLRQRGVVIWLDAPWEVFRTRLAESDQLTRPLIKKLGWAGMEDLYRHRRRLYAVAADFRIEAAQADVPDVARTIMLRSLIWQRRQEGKSR